METIVLTGKDYLTFVEKIYSEKNLSYLGNWQQPLKFFPKSYSLHQSFPGPCGFIAVFQSYIQYFLTKPEYRNPDHSFLLIEIILHIQSKISHQYAFCSDFDSKQVTFKIFSNKESATDYLFKSQITQSKRAILLLVLSFSYLGFKNNSLLSSQSFIMKDKMTTMSFVYFLLLGNCSDIILDQLQYSNYHYSPFPFIGIRVIGNKDFKLNKIWLNPDAKIFVCHQGNHFFSYEKVGQEAIVFNSFGKDGCPLLCDLQTLK